MLARSRGAARAGVEARLVDVEVDAAGSGTPGFRLVGLSATAARGMEQRVRGALRNRGLALPPGSVVVNFAPASAPKEGPPLDLPLAAALLGAAGRLPRELLAAAVLHGEVSLDGRVRPVAGALAAAEAARRSGATRFACAAAVAREAAAVGGLEVQPVHQVGELAAALAGEAEPATPPDWPPAWESGGPDLAEVRGQAQARRALELAATGGHGLLFVGPPGAGKSLLARRLPGLLPPLERCEALEVTRVRSAAGLTLSGEGPAGRRPFRAPHHGLSATALVGGGRPIGPGELSLAHRGVLFLDELPEFRRDALEALRQPLEEGRLAVARAAERATLPARVLLVAAMNPCPCGWLGSRKRSCSCSDGAVRRYRGRVSGPLLDRLDLHCEVPALPYDELGAGPPGEATAVVRERVLAARRRQIARQGGSNAALTGTELRRLVELEPGARALLRHALDRLGFSARAHDRVLRLALSLRDLARRDEEPPASGAPELLDEGAVAEALSYRFTDRATAWRAETGP